MNRDLLTDRILSAQSGLNSLKLKSGSFSQEDWGRLADAQARLHGLPLWIDDTPVMTYSELWRRARRMKRDHDIRLFFVDYLQLLTGDPGKHRVEEVSSISRCLKAMAREMRTPVIALSQLSRACENRETKRPQLSDLRDSGTIEQDADVVAFIYRDAEYDENSREARTVKFRISKQRNGATGEVRLRFYDRTTSFMEAKDG